MNAEKTSSISGISQLSGANLTSNSTGNLILHIVPTAFCNADNANAFI